MSVKFGNRGNSVTSIQQLLNAAPSRLAPLKVDGIFGGRTRERVLEFQKDNSLAADGLVGKLTMAALQTKRPNDAAFAAQLLKVAAQAGRGLTGAGATFFESQKRALLAPLATDGSVKAGVVGSPVVASFAVPFQVLFQFTPQGQLFMLLMVVMIMIVALMLSSRNPALRQRGRFWEREWRLCKAQQGRRAPVKRRARQPKRRNNRAGEYIDSKADSMKKCKDGNLNPSAPCARALAEIEHVMAELKQKLRQSFDSFPSLAAGVTRNMGELIAALRDAAVNCKGCDDLA